jgi:septal ring factor EnvC (AmiA/AmiB activator)
MDEYLIWLIFLALAIFSVCIIQLQEGRSKRLQEDCRQLQKNLLLWQDKLRKKEGSIDQLQRDFAQLLKWKERAYELEEELKRSKQTENYACAQRLQFLEESIAKSQTNPCILFLGTCSPQGRHSTACWKMPNSR